MPTIKTVERPYTITFTSSGHRYPLTSAEAQRLIGNYPAVRASRNQVALRGDGRNNTIIRAATLGGGSAFIVTD